MFARLRADILSGELRPGRRLRYEELCRHYGTSMGVLRESLLRLAEQGLVRGEQQQGFQVTPLSATDLKDLSDAREEIEGIALRRAVAEGDVAWESRLLAAHHRLERTPVRPADVGDGAPDAGPRRVSEEWVAAHSCFHSTLLEGGTNSRLKSIASAMRDASELYRQLSWSLGADHDRDVPAEHAAILQATLERDADLAAALLRAHIRRTTSALLAALEAGSGDLA